MGLFSFRKKKEEEKKITLGKEKIELLVEKLKKEHVASVILIEASAGNPALTDSKFGGYPYWEDGRDFPVNASGKPLALLAQINLSDLPDFSISDWQMPKKGLLQFFFDIEDDLMGLDFEGSTEGYKVVSWDTFQEGLSEEELKNRGVKTCTHCTEMEGEYAPFRDCYKLSFKKDIDYPSDYENEEITEVIKELFGYDIDPLELFRTISREDTHLYCELVESNGHKMFGHPFFTQEDPRHGDHEILLFQMDSETNNEKGVDICWGDSGVGNFFISEEDLKNWNFEDVLFNWDCY